MRLALALILVLAPLAQGYPLHGSNGAVECTIFGAFKDPFTILDVNTGRSIILNVDVGLSRANGTDVPRAQFKLEDGNDRVYPMSRDYSTDLQAGRRLLAFVVPRETVTKRLLVDPSADPSGGERFAIDFGQVINASNGKVAFYYYGILRSRMDFNRRTLDLDVGIANNDTAKLPLSAKNFTLIDQWGWEYAAKEYSEYSGDGFKARELYPNESLRAAVTFSRLSPLSRPARLAYMYSNNSSILVDIDLEGGMASRCPVLVKSAPESCCCGSSEAPTTLAGEIKATKARLAKVRESL